MKRLKITVDEFLSMTDSEWQDFNNCGSNLATEGIVDDNELVVDLQGMSIREIADKYHLISHNTLKTTLMEKFNLAK